MLAAGSGPAEQIVLLVSLAVVSHTHVWSKTSNTPRAATQGSQMKAAIYASQEGLGPLTWPRQTHVQEIPSALTSQKLKQKLFTGTADQQWLPTKTSVKVLAGWAPSAVNHRNRKRQQRKDFHLSHFGATSAAVSTAPTVFTFQAAKTRKEP